MPKSRQNQSSRSGASSSASSNRAKKSAQRARRFQKKPQQAKAPRRALPRGPAYFTSPGLHPDAGSEEYHKLLQNLDNQDDYLRSLAKQIILPSTTSAPEIIPMQTPSACCSRMITKEFVLGVNNFTADGSSLILVDPDLRMGVDVYSTEARNVPSAPGPTLFNGTFLCGVPAYGAVQGPATFTSAADDSVSLAMPQESTALGGVTKGNWPMYSYGAQVFNFTITPRTPAPNPVKLLFYTATAGSWGHTGESGIFQNATISGSFTINANSDRWGFTFADYQGNPMYKKNFSYDISGTLSGDGQIASGGGVHLWRCLPGTVLDEGITDVRLSAMSVLVTNTSPDMLKSGQIYAARTDRRLLASWPTFTDQFSGLSANLRYDGEAKHGAYVFWTPREAASRNLLPVGKAYEAMRNEDSLIVYMKGVNLEQPPSFRIRVNYIFDFYTDNQLFEKRLPRTLDDSTQALLNAVAGLPCASCNPDHVELFRSLVRRGLDGAQSMGQFYQDNKELFKMLFSIVAKAVS